MAKEDEPFSSFWGISGLFSRAFAVSFREGIKNTKVKRSDAAGRWRWMCGGAEKILVGKMTDVGKTVT